MSKNEEKKNRILSYKFSSHHVNLLKLEPGTIEFRKERKKAERAMNRFFNFIEKSLKKK